MVRTSVLLPAPFGPSSVVISPAGIRRLPGRGREHEVERVGTATDEHHLTGQVDQLVKTMHADDVSALLYGQECQYLGRRITPLAKADGGL